MNMCKVGVGSLLFSLAALPTAVEAVENLCYKVSYGTGFTKAGLLRPVKGFPNSHATVLYRMCKDKNKAGSPIPEGTTSCNNCKFGGDDGSSFGSCSSATGCITPPFTGCNGVGYVNAGSLFYAYNKPAKYSSNTGYEKKEAESIYFVQDDSDKVWLVLQHDMPDNADGGNMRLKITSNNLNGEVFVAQMDDPKTGQPYTNPDACNADTGDCYAWNPAQGRGGFNWNWAPCCTDGMIMGPFPSENFDITLTYTPSLGLNEFRYGTFDEAASDMLFTTIPWGDVTKPIKIEAFTCLGYCGVFTSFGGPSGTGGCDVCSAQKDGDPSEPYDLCLWCKDKSGAEFCSDIMGTGCAEYKGDCTDVGWNEQQTFNPTLKPTHYPTYSPTAPTSPTLPLTVNPTRAPTLAPTPSPSNNPTTVFPTANPTTDSPTNSPTVNPTKNPTNSPTRNPTTRNPTAPTGPPTTPNPTSAPSENPTTNPTSFPTATPTTAEPTAAPTKTPTTNPTTANPTTVNPTTVNPTTANPTTNPTTANPTTVNPTANPTTANPTARPTTGKATSNPTKYPTEEPTYATSAPTIKLLISASPPRASTGVLWLAMPVLLAGTFLP